MNYEVVYKTFIKNLSVISDEHWIFEKKTCLLKLYGDLPLDLRDYQYFSSSPLTVFPGTQKKSKSRLNCRNNNRDQKLWWFRLPRLATIYKNWHFTSVVFSQDETSCKWYFCIVFHPCDTDGLVNLSLIYLVSLMNFKGDGLLSLYLLFSYLRCKGIFLNIM